MMTFSPQTRASLLIRVRNPADQAAWHEFVEIYWPVIHRLARRKGLQEADADDLAQQVLMSVAKTIEERPHDPGRAKFRTWLGRVVQNAALNALTRAKPDRPAGGDSHDAHVRNAVSREPDSQLMQLELRREVFRWAARQVEREFQADTWQAFWLTAVEGRACDDAARKLKKGVGAVYAARSRVMKRLQEKIEEYAAESGSV
ncbi:RNA polymerase sigma factor RpoE [Caulifigura coniformis]|uniref:RNA polymerase sigma factor RpoE n=1 Tax=Caulifigura coniformis TaxID=2527983 RepID=A0A517SFK8_9PLAN|nr:sigma-70 family RNA polymerase sigma factor [Caulifigura coniformis]QDT54911.1 RNA polymerase sigma factor RpoE [Caulifigura coniformis]